MQFVTKLGCFKLVVSILASFICAGLCLGEVAQQPLIPALGTLPMRNGIDPKTIPEFWKDWHLVTTRFRTDNNEQRFSYANDIAWNAVVSEAGSYPVGSMLAKIAFSLTSDPHFPSSLEPARVTRIQIMRKEKKGINDAQANWSYWLYTGSVDAIQQSDKELAESCHACHQLVPHLDYVFSKAVFANNKTVMDVHKFKSKAFSDFFESSEVSKLNAREKSFLHMSQIKKSVRIHRMPLFEGSVSESIPTLIQEAKTGAPLLLADLKQKHMISAQSAPQKTTKECVEPVIISTTSSPDDKTAPLRFGLACKGKPTQWSGEFPK